MLEHGTEIDARLAFLLNVGLAEKRNNKIEVKEGWKDVLIATGRYNTFLAEWQKLNGKLKMYSGEGVRGKVSRVITFDRDESWNDALIVTIHDGNNVYVPIWQLKKENLIGKNIYIKAGNKSISRQTSNKDIYVIKNRDNRNEL